jgi:hypothetical protein
MADLGMSYDEVKLAMRIIHLRKGRMKAGKNQWRHCFHKDTAVLKSLWDKKHVEGGFFGWRLSSQGIQQLKQQIGEFTFR